MASLNKKKTKVISCYCNWPECEKYCSVIKANGPSGHHWKLPPIRFQFKERQPAKMYVTKSAFWQSVVFNLRSGEKITSSPSEIFINPHHFPLSFWQWNDKQLMKINICTPLSKSDAILISNHDLSHDRFYKDSNTVFKLHSKSIFMDKSTYGPIPDRFKLMYVKSPFVSRMEVRSLVHTLETVKNKAPKLHSSSITFDNHQQTKIIHTPHEPSSTPIDLSIENCYEHVNAKPQSELLNLSLSSSISEASSIFPSKYKCYQFLKNIFNNLNGDGIEFRKNQSFIMTSKMLSKVFDDETPIQLSSNGMTYYPCRNGVGITNNATCNLYSLRWTNTGKDMLCDSCQQTKTYELRNSNRLVLTPTRKRPYNSMSPQELSSSYNNVLKESRVLKCKYNRLIARFESKTSKFMIEDHSSAKTIMQDVLIHLKKRWSQTTFDVTKLIMELSLEEDSTDAISHKEKEACAGYICDTINNMSLHLNKKSKECRYSSHIMNICLALYSRSKTGYEELKDSGILPLPSSRTLERLTEPFKVNEGFDPKVNFLLDLKSDHNKCGGIVKGHLMMDEIKLKNGIMWNPNSNVVTGFVTDDLNTNNMLQEILGMKKTSKISDKQLSVSANQWRFRSTRGLTHNSYYYYNIGSLDGNQILGQFIDVVSSYELLGVQIIGLVSDGGGSNVKFFNTLFGIQCKYSKWPLSDSVYTLMCMKDNSRLIYWYCSVHGLKALRNNLFRSQSNMARDLMLHGRQFGWKEVKDIYLRDVKYYHKTGVWRTDLKKEATTLDGFTMMNVTYAKSVFSEKTICFQMSYLIKELDIVIDTNPEVKYDSTWHQYNAITQRIVSKSHNIRDYDLIPAINLLEYQVAVYGIYTERFMNAKWKLTRKNIDREEETVNSIMIFFYEWCYSEVTSKRGGDVPSKNLESRYIADQTHNNMNVLCKGFLEYARYILKDSDDSEYVPALHSSQSSIENHFSCVRDIGKDRTDVYGTAVVQLNIRSNMKSTFQLKGNSSYVADKPEQSNGYTFDIIKVKHNIKMLQENVSVITNRYNYPIKEMSCTNLLPVNEVSSQTIAGFNMGKYFYDAVLKDNKSYQGILKDDHRFKSLFVLCVNSSSASFFKQILDPKLERLVDMVCSNIMEVIYNLLSISTNVKSGFYGNLIQLLCQPDGCQLNDIILQAEAKFDIELKLKRIEKVVLVNILVHIFMEEYLPDIVTAYRKKEIVSASLITRDIVPFNTSNIINTSDVNRIFGWSLYKEKKSMMKMIRTNNCNNLHVIKLGILDNMTVLMTDVLLDTNYVKIYVPVDDRIRNKGYLTLISPKYAFMFAQILTVITNETTVNIDGNQFAKPDKVKIKSKLLEVSNNKSQDHVMRLVNKVKADPAMCNVDKDIIQNLLYSLIDRVLNAIVGGQVKIFRSKKLSRVNDVTFRTRLKTKCEERNV